MSKLFDTLEQIRRNESYHVSGGTPRQAPGLTGKKRLKNILLAMVILGACLAAVYFAAARFTERAEKLVTPDYLKEPGAIASSSTILASPGPTPADQQSAQDITTLNNTAVELVKNHEHWRGIFILENILARHPDRIEPLINLGAALAELGLTEPAKRFLRRAETLDRNHPALQRNIAILKKAGVPWDDSQASGKD